MRRGFPRAGRGLSIGLLGGSFDPAHSGHAHVAETAMKRLGLDFVWWLVSPQNPLKSPSSPLASRLLSAALVARGPKMVITNVETLLNTAFTVDTLRALKRSYPGTRFIWLMGGDNLAGFARWHDWEKIVAEVAIAVVARPGAGPKARLGKLAQRFPHSRISTAAARAFALHKPPAWLYIPARLDPTSSTALRARGIRPPGLA